MKRFLILLTGVMSLGLAVGTPAAPTPYLRVHFLGSQTIAADAEYPSLAPVFGGAEAHATVATTLNKLAVLPRNWLAHYLPTTANSGAELVRPLLDDLASSEWYLATADAGHARPDVTLSVRLTPARAALWKSSLNSLFTGWLGTPPAAQGSALTWSLPGGAVVRLHSGAEWFTVALGGTPGLQADQPAANRSSAWLTLDADLSRLAHGLPQLGLADLPIMHLEAIGRRGQMEVNARAEFSGAAPGSDAAWQIPTKAIHSPCDAFTAARGLGAWLAQQAWYPTAAFATPPDQFVAWSMNGAPFANYLAIPCASAPAALAQLQNYLIPLFDQKNARNEFLTKLTFEPGKNTLDLHGVPAMAVPQIRALTDPSGQYLLASLLPAVPHGPALPPQLLTDLQSPNLVYFHWEKTADRVPQLLQVTQLGLVLTLHQQLVPTFPAAAWLNHVTPLLGQSMTQIKKTGPRELTLTRTATCGLTAWELYVLANWLQAPNFPGWEAPLPKPDPSRLHRLHHKPLPGAPAPVPAPAMAPPAH